MEHEEQFNQGKMKWEEDKQKFKKLLNKPILPDILGDKVRPLFNGYISKSTNNLRSWLKPTTFIYTDEDEKLYVLDYNPDFNDTACKLCACLRKDTAFCEKCTASDIDAAQNIIDFFNKGTPIDEGRYHREDGSAILYFWYLCEPLQLEEWIFPVLIDGSCVGAFITGQFYHGNDADISSRAKEIAGEYSDSGLTSKDIEAILKETKPNETLKAELIANIKNIQNEIQKSYGDVFKHAESRIQKHLTDMIWGEQTPYENIPSLKDTNLGDIFQVIRFVRTNLFDSAVTLSGIYDLREVCVYKPLSEPMGLEQHDELPGALLTGEKEKIKGDELKFDRQFYTAMNWLNIKKIREEETENEESRQHIGITAENDKCCDYLIYEPEANKKNMSNIRVEEVGLSCRFLTGGEKCSYCYRRHGIQGNSLPCDNIRDGVDICPYLLSGPQTTVTKKSRYENCLLVVQAAKSFQSQPVGFFVRYTEIKNNKKYRRYIVSLKDIIDQMITVFLTQWNMLVAEYNHLINLHTNLYKKHELNQALSGMIGLENKLNDMFNKTLLPEARKADIATQALPTPISDILDYMGHFVSDQQFFIGQFSNIINNMDLLTDTRLDLRRFNIYERILNRINVAYRYINDRDTRVLICPFRYNGGFVFPKITADASKIEQIINNLVQNAFKYSHKYSNIRIELGLRDKNTTAYISVISYGDIISEDDRERIFDLGYRGGFGNFGLNRESGSGYGLYIARRLARLHGGDVILEQPEHLADLNIPLIRGYQIAGTNKFPMDPNTVKRCKELYASIKNELYREVVNTRYFNRNDTLPTPAYYKEYINDPTYRITFTLTLPIDRPWKGVEDNDFAS